MARDLDAATLSRYQTEVRESPKEQSGHTFILENTNLWPLGLAAYWKQGTVRAVHVGADQYEYVVSSSRGYGPLSIVYVSKTQTAFDGNGRRKSQMAGSSILWGHLAMFHAMGSQTSHGHWMKHKTAHYLHHLLNFGSDHGGAYFSLASSPNPIGVGQ
jgi:hypothetical protein